MIIYSLFDASGMMSSLFVALARKQANSLEEGGERRPEMVDGVKEACTFCQIIDVPTK